MPHYIPYFRNLQSLYVPVIYLISCQSMTLTLMTPQAPPTVMLSVTLRHWLTVPSVRNRPLDGGGAGFTMGVYVPAIKDELSVTRPPVTELVAEPNSRSCSVLRSTVTGLSRYALNSAVPPDAESLKAK